MPGNPPPDPCFPNSVPTEKKTLALQRNFPFIGCFPDIVMFAWERLFLPPSGAFELPSPRLYLGLVSLTRIFLLFPLKVQNDCGFMLLVGTTDCPSESLSPLHLMPMQHASQIATCSPLWESEPILMVFCNGIFVVFFSNNHVTCQFIIFMIWSPFLSLVLYILIETPPPPLYQTLFYLYITLSQLLFKNIMLDY